MPIAVRMLELEAGSARLVMAFMAELRGSAWQNEMQRVAAAYPETHGADHSFGETPSERSAGPLFAGRHWGRRLPHGLR